MVLSRLNADPPASGTECARWMQRENDMQIPFNPAPHLVTVFAMFAAAVPSDLLAQAKFESPPSFNAATIPRITASGPNYTIQSPVRSDGFLRIYLLKTPYGQFTVTGDAMTQMRLRELSATNQLDAFSQSEAFNKALAEAGLSPIKYAGQLVTNPLQTLGNTLAGAGMLMGQFGSSIVNAGKTRDDPMAGLLGVTKQKRELATRIGVDPYTDFEPLKARLDRLSEAAAAGGLVVGGALLAIPGAAGVVISNVSTSSNLTTYARDFTASQLMDFNRSKLRDLSVPDNVIEELLANRRFSPLDVTAMAVALEGLGAVEGRPSFIARAARVTNRDAAFFMRTHAEMLAAHQAKTGALRDFVWLGEFPFNRLRDGGVAGVWPVDAIAWTETTARTLGAASEQRKRTGIAGRAEIRITGQATALAKRHLKQLGWTVVENVRL